MILQIVGFKNSGKTTLMAYAVHKLKTLGYPVVTIKHHGHADEEITLPVDTVDHMRHFKAGADQSIVQGHDYIEMIQRNNQTSLETLIESCVTMDNSIILVEGYKQAQYHKVIVYSTEDEKLKLQQLENVQYQINGTVENIDFSKFGLWLEMWAKQRVGE
ncbi:molybdopterin-guanine dinucleotide biosynthesis protein B [Staphylococcus sp. 17KM0847]|uniref:molybdopterin-guanine dinucleotide biosynthesis protein B n=1 Tax=Staphylococcus sp. 17KM0847 TaxID=2583989 RepID=UPI0015DD126D|nr:molybdopterin-guanine dinucleotide biosynthesis protein B [Staphylococcus sp. 17KM0847]QLK86638.1 molybdopterin-guanine dinucleotide biosynthesis protein B [Staphylococcus sp. 17KM0847]